MIKRRNISKPFHTVCVTSPDYKSAEAASSGPLNKNGGGCNKYLSDVNIYSTSDPFDTRMGSGGGTLAALDLADRNNNRSMSRCSSSNQGPKEELENEYDDGGVNDNGEEEGSVLIIHAGGESSRCPTQITLGKAWTSLPIANDTLTNPTYLLIETLDRVLAELPSGSVVVAASDVLLSLPMKSPIKFDRFSHDCDKVLGLAVPAPLETAVNHGVFVLKEDGEENEDGSCQTDNDGRIRHINAFLQKPSIDDMKEFKAENMAWIDTGVIVFLPLAAKALRSMMSDDLSICTKAGLERLYQIQRKGDPNTENIYEYAKEKSVKVELYSHLLLAISTEGSRVLGEKRRLENYLSESANKDLDSKLLKFIFQHLAKFELQVCVIPDGTFIHLGTSNELLRFLICGTDALPCSNSELNHREFGKRIELEKESQLFCSGISVQNCVALNSSFLAAESDQCSIGKGTVVEHSRLRGSFSIGSNCLVSGLRGKWGDCLLKIPNNFVCQIVKLQDNWAETLGFSNGTNYENKSCVCLYHNIDDAIKARRTCYGVPFQDLFHRTGLTPSDLWDGEKQELLWNAKINPIFQNDVLDWTVFSWIEDMTSHNSILSSNESLHKWRAQPRISLAQLRSVADVSFEFSYRVDCQSVFENSEKVQNTLLLRRNEELNTDLAMFDDNACNSFLQALDNTIMLSINDGSIDISSRAFMMMSILLTRLAENMQTAVNEHSKKRFNIRLISDLTRKELQVNACQKILINRDLLLASNPSKSDLLECADAFEEAASQLTKLCVSTGVSVKINETRPQVGTWVLAEAPARVDLSGGVSLSLSYIFIQGTPSVTLFLLRIFATLFPNPVDRHTTIEL